MHSPETNPVFSASHGADLSMDRLLHIFEAYDAFSGGSVGDGTGVCCGAGVYSLGYGFNCFS
jgi:hypothetical protein